MGGWSDEHLLRPVAHEWLGPVQSPQLQQEVRDDDVVGVLGHHAQHEDAVVAQVVVSEAVSQTLVLFARQLALGLEGSNVQCCVTSTVSKRVALHPQ